MAQSTARRLEPGLRSVRRLTRTHGVRLLPFRASPSAWQRPSSARPALFGENAPLGPFLIPPTLELRVLGLEGLQPSRIRHFHAAILRPPFVKGRVADPVLAALLLRAEPGLVLLQDANNLFFAETASLHRLSPQLENRLTSNRGLFREARHLANSCFYAVVFRRFSLCMAHFGSGRPRSCGRFCWPWQPLPLCLVCAIRCPRTTGRTFPAPT